MQTVFGTAPTQHGRGEQIVWLRLALGLVSQAALLAGLLINSFPRTGVILAALFLLSELIAIAGSRGRDLWIKRLFVGCGVVIVLLFSTFFLLGWLEMLIAPAVMTGISLSWQDGEDDPTPALTAVGVAWIPCILFDLWFVSLM
jgi:hypothetical protein